MADRHDLPSSVEDGVGFQAAVEAGDADALLATLAPDVRFHSPAVFRPYEGREAVTPLLRAVVTVLSPPPVRPRRPPRRHRRPTHTMIANPS